MEIKISDKVVGSIYMNIQLPMKNFEGKNHAEILDLIKGSNGIDQQVFELSIGKFKIASFRRFYKDGVSLCIEGAELVPAVTPVVEGAV